jgi:Leucine-rich repeat (LRR) protein
LLDLQDNALTGSIPSRLAILPNLQVLMLNKNKLSDTFPTGLGQLTALCK